MNTKAAAEKVVSPDLAVAVAHPKSKAVAKAKAKGVAKAEAKAMGKQRPRQKPRHMHRRHLQSRRWMALLQMLLCPVELPVPRTKNVKQPNVVLAWRPPLWLPRPRPSVHGWRRSWQTGIPVAVPGAGIAR